MSLGFTCDIGKENVGSNSENNVKNSSTTKGLTKRFRVTVTAVDSCHEIFVSLIVRYVLIRKNSQVCLKFMY